MDTPAPRPAPAAAGPRGGLPRWLRAQRHAVAMAGLLSFAAPLVFFTGAISVMQAPRAGEIAALGLWWLLYALLLWGLMLLSGQCCHRLWSAARHARARAAALPCAAAAAALATLATAGRADILLAHGVVTHTGTMHLHAFTLSTALTLLYHVHLRRSWAHAAAVVRLAAAQAAQRIIERRMLQTRLQAVQARIDPQLLFEMLDAVRRWYAHDAARAEQLLDALVAFLRAALPRLRDASSSVLREAELAQAGVRLRALAGAGDFGLQVRALPGALHARCPPGVLLPLLDDALRRAAGPCRLDAACDGAHTRLALTLPAPPSAAVLQQVRTLLAALYGSGAALTAQDAHVTVSLPHEPA